MFPLRNKCREDPSNEHQVKKSVADYLVDAPADAKLTDKLNLEDMVFDYAGEFVDRMMEESEQIRNAITEPLA